MLRVSSTSVHTHRSNLPSVAVRPPPFDARLNLLLGLLVGEEGRSVENELVDGEVGFLSTTKILLDVLARELDLRRVCEKPEVRVSGSGSAFGEAYQAKKRVHEGSRGGDHG